MGIGTLRRHHEKRAGEKIAAVVAIEETAVAKVAPVVEQPVAPVVEQHGEKKRNK